MRRTNGIKEQVSAPSRGLITRIPPNVTAPDKRAIVAGENVRAEQGVLANAPGHERIITSPSNLDSPANAIFQANILNQDAEIRNTPLIGTGTKLYTVSRRSRALVCDTSGSGGSSCLSSVAYLGDSGRISSDLLAVSNLIKSRNPDFVIHLGDLVYADGGLNPSIADYEECIGQYFGSDYIGGYNGTYGIGPAENRFFPVLGNHDWDDGGLDNYLDFFQLAKNPNERYFHYKRGPVHHIHYSGYEGTEPDGVALGSTQADWLEGVLAESDCPHILLHLHFPLWTSDVNYYPGSAALQTLAPLLRSYNVVVISGHAHNNEILLNDGLYNLISGSGGHSLRAFNAPPSPYSVWKDNSAYGAMFLDATRESLTFEWVTVSGASLRTLTIPAVSRDGVSEICYIGDAAKEVFTLEVRPESASAEVGHSWPFRAFANYMDGTVEDVTEESTWAGSDDSIAAVSSIGVATGNTPGEITVTATFKGVSDTAQFIVLFSCLDDDYEVMFVVDRGSSMGAASGGASRLQNVKDGIELAIQGFDSAGGDKIGLVSFAGTFATQTEDATLDSSLTDDFASVVDAISLLVPDGARSLAEALDTAYDEITSARHTSGNKRSVVLVLDGPGSVQDPGGTAASFAAAVIAAMSASATAATAIKALTDTILVVVGYNIPAAYLTNIRNLATDGYYFGVNTAEEVEGVLSGLSNLFCTLPDYYFYGPPPGEDSRCNNPQADYRNFIGATVTRGCIDLCGAGPNGEADSTAWDPRPGNGFYIDMIGTLADHSPGHDTTCGKLVIEDEVLHFVAGKEYKLSFYDCNYRPILRYIDVTVGDNPAERFTPANDDFVLEEITWTQVTTGDYPIIFDSEIVPPSTFPALRFPVTGVLVDRILLENLTDATTIYSNDFNNENPCE